MFSLTCMIPRPSFCFPPCFSGARGSSMWVGLSFFFEFWPILRPPLVKWRYGYPIANCQNNCLDLRRVEAQTKKSQSCHETTSKGKVHMELEIRSKPFPRLHRSLWAFLIKEITNFHTYWVCQPTELLRKTSLVFAVKRRLSPWWQGEPSATARTKPSKIFWSTCLFPSVLAHGSMLHSSSSSSGCLFSLSKFIAGRSFDFCFPSAVPERLSYWARMFFQEKNLLK